MLTVQEIIQNKVRFYLCAKAFRDDANSLMLQLADKFGFDINECGAWPTAVSKTKYSEKGILNLEWTFYLHGSHCRFDNVITGQAVEVLFTEKPEFGYIDGFFFYNYIRTTVHFQDLAAIFTDELNVYKAIDVLVEEGTLTQRINDRSIRNVIAL